MCKTLRALTAQHLAHALVKWRTFCAYGTDKAETSIFPNFSILLSYIHSSMHFSSFIQTFIQSTKNSRIKQRGKVTNNVIKGSKSANVIELQSNPSKCHKKPRKNLE